MQWESVMDAHAQPYAQAQKLVSCLIGAAGSAMLVVAGFCLLQPAELAVLFGCLNQGDGWHAWLTFSVEMYGKVLWSRKRRAKGNHLKPSSLYLAWKSREN